MIPVPPEVVLKRRPAGWQKQERVVEDGRVINAVGSRLKKAEGDRRGEYLSTEMLVLLDALSASAIGTHSAEKCVGVEQRNGRARE